VVESNVATVSQSPPAATSPPPNLDLLFLEVIRLQRKELVVLGEINRALRDRWDRA
jgi:hypothetical protein